MKLAFRSGPQISNALGWFTVHCTPFVSIHAVPECLSGVEAKRGWICKDFWFDFLGQNYIIVHLFCFFRVVNMLVGLSYWIVTHAWHTTIKTLGQCMSFSYED